MQLALSLAGWIKPKRTDAVLDRIDIYQARILEETQSSNSETSVEYIDRVLWPISEPSRLLALRM